jgi:hypothetical protein
MRVLINGGTKETRAKVTRQILIDLHEGGKNLSAFISTEHLEWNRKALPSFNWDRLAPSTSLVETNTSSEAVRAPNQRSMTMSAVQQISMHPAQPLALGPVDWNRLSQLLPKTLASLALGVSPSPPQTPTRRMSDNNPMLIVEDATTPQGGNTPALLTTIPAQQSEVYNSQALLAKLDAMLSHPIEGVIEANNSLLKEVAAQRATINQLVLSQKTLETTMLKTSAQVTEMQKEQLALNEALLREIPKMLSHHAAEQSMLPPPEVDRSDPGVTNQYRRVATGNKAEETLPPVDPRKEFAAKQLEKFEQGKPPVNFWHLGLKWAQMQEIPANRLEPDTALKMEAYAAKLVAPLQRSVDYQVQSDKDAKQALMCWKPIRTCDLVVTLAYLLSERVVRDSRNILCPTTVGFAIANSAKDALAWGDTPKTRLTQERAALHLVVKKAMQDLCLDESVGGLRFALQEKTPKTKAPRHHGSHRARGSSGRGGRGRSRGRGRPNYNKRAYEPGWSNDEYDHPPSKRGRG